MAPNLKVKIQKVCSVISRPFNSLGYTKLCPKLTRVHMLPLMYFLTLKFTVAVIELILTRQQTHHPVGTPHTIIEKHLLASQPSYHPKFYTTTEANKQNLILSLHLQPV